MGIGEKRKLIPLPRVKKTIHKFDCEHYSKIGKIIYPLSKLLMISK